MRPTRRVVFTSFVVLGVSTAAAAARIHVLDQQEGAGIFAQRAAAASGVVSITDPTGDAHIRALFDAPNTHVHVNGNTITATLPSWLWNNATTFPWDIVSLTPDGLTELKRTAQTTWSSGSSSQITSAANNAIPDYADVLTASIQQPDSQHLTFTATARGPISDDNSDFVFEMGPYSVELGGRQMVAAAPKSAGFFTKHLAAPYDDITAATAENRNGILHLTLTTAAPIPMTPAAGEQELRYIWNFQGSQKRLAARLNLQGTWVLETRLPTGGFFPEIGPTHGTLSIVGNTITIDEPVTDLDFQQLSFFVSSATDILDGPDTFYTALIDTAPDRQAFTAPPLNVASLTANPATVRSGQPVTLAWVVEGASTVAIDNGVGTQPASGSLTVTPTATTTYTLTATQNGSTATATVTVTVLANPIVNVTAIPAAMLQAANSGGATTTYALTNSGSAATTIMLTQSGPAFFTQSPSTFTLQPGATQTITITALPQTAGAYEAASVPTGNGVPPGLTVPVRLLAAAPPAGTVTADASTNRVDVASNANTNPTGSVSFTNNGSATLLGILSSDVPWIIPQSGIVTIAPGQTVNLTFTIDRVKRPDAATLIGSAEGNLTLSFLSGGGSSFAKRPLDTTTVIPSVTLVKVVDTVQPTVTIGGIPALAPGEVALFVPGVGHVTGKSGTLFVSDVSLLNAQQEQSVSDVKLYYTPASNGNATSAKTTALNAVPGQVSVAMADIVKNIFNGTDEVGTMQVRSQSAAKLNVAATVSTANNPAGTFGNTIPVFRSDRAAQSGDTIMITGLRKDSSTYTNLFIQEVGGATASVKLDFWSVDGTAVGTGTQSVGAFQLLPLLDMVPSNAVAVVITNQSATVAKIAAYATAVDTVTNDTWTLADWGQQLGYAPNETIVIPVAGSVHGANGTFYRTDVAISSRSTAANATLRYVARDGSHTDVPISMTSGLQTRVITDVVGTAMNIVGDSVGFLELIPTSGTFAVTSRTFTTINNKPGTFGIGVPAIAASSAITAGSTRSIAGLSDAARTTVVAGRPGTFRTNFGLVETTGKPVTVRVTFRFTFPAGAKAQGIGSAFRDYPLNGGGFLMLNSLAGEILGPSRLQFGDLTNVEADFQVISGSGAVVLFTSSVDNATGDSFLRMQ